ncbi:spore germination protein GerPC [Niallia endozanthoxylica]|uniref:Spore gernimation protein n=1 Tax=Niallia endozanthoxylica TaxID=2036016 RepID=A0A5J5HYB1_9BACI|nr:spore germination protein GerPC [Niallia endozanthoxylica]KAA9027513.1 spore gernimation protein [Niallia endozanthoxylica]
MSQNMYRVIQSIQAYVYAQDKTIRKLQKKIDLLEKKITELQDRPPVRVEKMEYKFDQLKVETLEGTLNIGLNPSDLQAIDDLSVPNQKSQANPKERMSLFTELESSINEYLDENLQTVMANTGKQLQMRVDNTYREFILQDIKKQLPNRIEYYLNQPIRNGNTPEQHKEWILEQMKKEIHNGVLTFLQHLPENMKGTNKE